MTNQSIIRKEFALSGSEQNPDLTGQQLAVCIERRAVGKNAPPGRSRRSRAHGEDFIVVSTFDDLVAGMNALQGGDLLTLRAAQREIEARDREIANPFTKDSAGDGHPQRAPVPRRQAGPHRQAAPPSRSGARSPDRGAPRTS